MHRSKLGDVLEREPICEPTQTCFVSIHSRCQKYRIPEIQKSRNPEIHKSRNPDFWISGFLDFWISGFLDSWISGFPDFWISGFLDFWIPGFLDFWISGFLDSWILGFLDFWTSVRLQAQAHWIPVCLCFRSLPVLQKHSLSALRSSPIRCRTTFRFVLCFYITWWHTLL